MALVNSFLENTLLEAQDHIKIEMLRTLRASHTQLFKNEHGLVEYDISLGI